jgi:competence protein ComEC
MTDLRMAPAALVVWVAAWLLTGPGVGWTGPATWVAAALVAATCLHLLLTVALTRGTAWPVVPHVTLAAACALAVTVSAHVQLAGRAPLGDLAEQRVTVTLTGLVVSQPEPFSFAPDSFAPGAGQHRWVLAAWKRAASARRPGRTSRCCRAPRPGTGRP